jgi:Raf kinase inhibitor-like YbhB/YbcL family protein
MKTTLVPITAHRALLGALGIAALLASTAACGDDETATSATQNPTTTTASSMGGMGGNGGMPVGPGGGGTGGIGGTGPTGGAGPFTLTSPAFTEGEMIPQVHVCQPGGGGISPQLDWTGVPSGTQSFAVVLRDLDFNGFLHWVIWDIPVGENGLPEGVENEFMPAIPAGAKQAITFDNQTRGYYGPCSPNSVNTYQFTVYAIDAATLMNLGMQSSMQQAATEIEAHDVGSATLSGES